MNIFNKKLLILMSGVLFFMNVTSYAKVRSIKARRDFNQSIAKESMVVALFYDDRNKDFIKMYEDISGDQRYDNADVVFLKANAVRKDLRDLARTYGVTEMPAFIFFHKGKCLRNNRNKAIILTGFVTQEQLRQFIDTHYGKEIDQYIVQKEARKQERVAQENDNWKPYFYPRDMFVPGYDPAERSLE